PTEMFDLLTRDVRELRIAVLSGTNAVSQVLGTFRKLGQVDLVHEPLLFEHLSILDRAPLTVSAARDVENHDVAVEVRVARPARRMLELRDDGRPRELQPRRPSLRHAR